LLTTFHLADACLPLQHHHSHVTSHPQRTVLKGVANILSPGGKCFLFFSSCAVWMVYQITQYQEIQQHQHLCSHGQQLPAASHQVVHLSAPQQGGCGHGSLRCLRTLLYMLHPTRIGNPNQDPDNKRVYHTHRVVISKCCCQHPRTRWSMSTSPAGRLCAWTTW
jgi:hypothetical protein